MALQGQEGHRSRRLCRDRRVTPRGTAGTAGSHPGALLQPPLDFPPEEAWQGSELLSDTFNSSAANAAASSLPQQGDFWGEVCGAAERKTSCDVRKAAWKRKKKKKNSLVSLGREMVGDWMQGFIEAWPQRSRVPGSASAAVPELLQCLPSHPRTGNVTGAASPGLGLPGTQALPIPGALRYSGCSEKLTWGGEKN